MINAISSPVKSDPNTVNKKEDNTNKFKKTKKNDEGIVIIPFPFHEDTIVNEILTRLPVKSLLRFKSVSKSWNSIIQEDQNFIDSHLTRSKSRKPNLYIIAAVPNQTYKPEYDGDMFLTCDLFEDFCREEGRTKAAATAASVQFCDLRKAMSFHPDKITNSINGLICFIDSQFHHNHRLYNISTREESPLIKSMVLEKEKYDDNSLVSESNYQFGYDPASREYKLVAIHQFHTSVGRKSYSISEVLTVLVARVGGEDNCNKLNRWRRIDEVPPYFYVTSGCPSVYLNGSIYWSTSRLFMGATHRDVCIIALDVGSEKFRAISIPSFILVRPTEYFKHANGNERPGRQFPYVDLLEVDRCVALQIKMTSYIVKLWILDDEKKDNATSNNHNWTEVTITLPFCCSNIYQYVRLYTVFNQIIIKTFYRQIWDASKEEKEKERQKNGSLYLFDRKKNIVSELETGGFPYESLIPYLRSASLCTKFVESLLPVKQGLQPMLDQSTVITRNQVN